MTTSLFVQFHLIILRLCLDCFSYIKMATNSGRSVKLYFNSFVK
jgi:hypothetical protein